MSENKEHILSLSYGKDSLACLGAIEELGWQLDRIVHAEVWATDTVPGDPPPMVEFKAKADEIIKERWGIEVEHFRADITYEQQFYTTFKKRNKRATVRTPKDKIGKIYGWPFQRGAWCNSRLKMAAINKAKAATGNQSIQYIGIAIDEPNRFHNLTETTLSPLVALEWDEAYCRKWCEQNDLLSPIYTTATRGGCWFCHNQGVDQLRLLRRNYPDYWQLMLKWDKDSPWTFRPDGHTVHDFEKRFKLEDEGLILPEERFRWDMLESGCVNYRLF